MCCTNNRFNISCPKTVLEVHCKLIEDGGRYYVNFGVEVHPLVDYIGVGFCPEVHGIRGGKRPWRCSVNILQTT